jgi:hypothetical protein
MKWINRIVSAVCNTENLTLFSCGWLSESTYFYLNLIFFFPIYYLRFVIKFSVHRQNQSFWKGRKIYKSIYNYIYVILCWSLLSHVQLAQRTSKCQVLSSNLWPLTLFNLPSCKADATCWTSDSGCSKSGSYPTLFVAPSTRRNSVI